MKQIICKIALFSTSFLGIIPNIANAQGKYNFDTQSIENRLKNDIKILASDSLEGRESGTKGEMMAADYIVAKFKEIGLKHYYINSYKKSFDFLDGWVYGDSNSLIINNKVFKLGKDFYPLTFSENKSFEGDLVKVGFGIISPKDNFDDYKNLKNLKDKIFVIEASMPNNVSKSNDITDYESKIDTAIAKGAAGIIFINSDIKFDKPTRDLSSTVLKRPIPIIFADQLAYKLIMDGTVWKAKIKVDLKKVEKKGYNVAGYIDNGAKQTVIIGGHFDHLGFGGDGSRSPGSKEVHHGADDNASGTAGMIEMARYYKSVSNLKNNYVFVGFSAEEKGMIGSSNFLKSYTDVSNINFMINLDMIGRLDTTKKGLLINGTGTSTIWDSLIKVTPTKEFRIKTSESGMGSSDQMAFTLKDIPVLFFFSDIEPDYHKPSDTWDKINFPGEVKIIQYAEQIIDKADKLGKLTFVKLKEANNQTQKFKGVTIGVVPDHSYSGVGMRIDGIIDGRPGQKAGLLAGDIVLKIGEHEVSEIMSYMKALGFFKKGEKSTITIKRGEETLVKDIEF